MEDKFRKSREEQINFSSGGPLGELIRKVDWSETNMGAIEDWPEEFKENLQKMLNAFPSNQKNQVKDSLETISANKSKITEIEERFQLIAHATNDTIWDWNLLTNQVWWNDSIQSMFGYESKEVGNNAEWWIQNIHPEDRQRIVDDIYQLIESGGDSWSNTYRFKCDNGSFAEILDRGYIIHDESGKSVRMVGSMLDLTEQKKSETQLRNTLESIGDGFFACDENWAFTYVNSQAEKLLGIKREEVIGKSHWEVFPLTLGTAIEDEYKLAASGEIRDWENYYEPWDKWFHNRVFPREGGGITVYFREITEQKKAAQALRLSAERFLTISSSNIIGVVIGNHKGDIAFANEYFLNIIGYSQQELEQKQIKWTDITPSEFLDLDYKAQKELQKTGKAEIFEKQYIHKDGSRRWVSLSNAALSDSHGNILALVLDITQKNEAEESLLKANERLQKTIDSITDGLIILDRQWNIIELSNTGARLIGMNRENLIGKNVWKVFPQAEGTKFYQEYHRAIEMGKPIHFEEFYPEPLNQWLEVNCYPDEEGLIVYFNDITKRKKAEHDLQRKTAELEATIDAIPDGYIIYDNYGNINRMNNIAVEILGWSEDELKLPYEERVELLTVTKPDGSVFPKEELPSNLAQKGKTSHNVQMKIEKPGKIYWLSVSASPITAQDGTKLGVVMEFTDITENKLVELALRQSEERFRLAVDAAKLGVFSWSAKDDQATWENNRMYEILGIAPEEQPISGERFAKDVAHPQDSARFQNDLSKSLEKGSPFHGQYRFRRLSDNAWRWLQFDGQYNDKRNGNPFMSGVTADITDQKLAEEERENLLTQIATERQRLETVLEQLPVGVMIAEASGKITYANEYAVEMFGQGYSREGFEQYVDEWQPYHPDGRIFELDEIPMYRALQGLESEDVEMHFRLKNEENLIYAYVNGVPVKDKQGQVIEGVVSILDIGLRKELEDKLRENEVRFRTLANNISQLAWMTDETGYIFWYNKRWFDYTGTNLEEMKGWGWRKVHHPDHVDRVVNKVSRNFENGEIWEDTFPLRRQDGVYRWFLSRAIPIHDENGKILHWFGTNTDITDLKQAQETLKYQKSLLEAQQEVSPLGILVLSPQGKILTCNNLFAEMWRVPQGVLDTERDEILLQTSKKQVKYPELFLHKIKQCYELQEKNHEKVHFKDGRIFERYGSPIADEAGNYYGYVWFFMDITEREYLARQKDDFLGIASHELKTPVAVMKGYVNMIEQLISQKEKAAELPLIKKVDQQINRLTGLINDLLDVTKIEAGKIEFAEEAYHFDQLVEEITESMQNVSKHPLKLTGKTGKQVIGDKDRTGQVIINFISNAIKYTPGISEIEVKIEAFDEDVTLQVIDQGMGIADEDLPKIFDRFYRVRETSGKKSSGLGLGLYICAQIIQRQKGKIWAESDLDKGSVFSFSLPVQQK